MKKFIVGLLIVAFSLGSFNVVQAAEGRGGFMGFIAGCCFGPRAAADYNDGLEIHWREWLRLIPYLGIVFAIWDGVDGVQGTTTTDLAARYGSSFY